MSAEFVDTNVLLYAFSEDEPVKRERAQSLLERLWQRGTGRLSTQVLQEFYVNATRKLARALSSEEAQAIVLSLSQCGAITGRMPRTSWPRLYWPSATESPSGMP